jgi:transcriptional regulator of acetoin/glycerol metabolism
LEKLSRYHWPGNIRELQHTIEKAVIMCDGDKIMPEDLWIMQTATSFKTENDVTIEIMEKKMIVSALTACEGNISEAATQLGISRQTLYNKIKRYEV